MNLYRQSATKSASPKGKRLRKNNFCLSAHTGGCHIGFVFFVGLCPIELAGGIRKEVIILAVFFHIRVKRRFNGVCAGVAYGAYGKSFFVIGVIGGMVRFVKRLVASDIRLYFITVIEIGYVGLEIWQTGTAFKTVVENGGNSAHIVNASDWIMEARVITSSRLMPSSCIRS